MNANASAAAIPSLYELFMGLADPRDPRGLRHPLAALLTLATTAMLAGAKSLTDIAQFGRRRRKLCRAMGFTHKKPPCISTFHYLFKDLDAVVFEGTLQEWLQAHHPQVTQQNPMLHIDGKALRGSRRGDIPGVHLLAAYSNTLGTVLSELPVDTKTNEHKAALQLLKLIPLQGVLVTGDAAFTQKDFSQAVIAGGGDYFLTVKDNQPGLKQALLDAFDAPVSPSGHSGAACRSADGHDAG
jgi:hypothetical protein